MMESTNTWIEIFRSSDIVRSVCIAAGNIKKKPTKSKLNLRRKWAKCKFQDVHMWFNAIEIGPKNFFSPFETSALQLLSTGIKQLLYYCRCTKFCSCLLFSEEKSSITIFRWLETRKYGMHFMPISITDTIWHIFRDANFANHTKFNFFCDTHWFCDGRQRKKNQVPRENNTATVM